MVTALLAHDLADEEQPQGELIPISHVKIGRRRARR
jgi:hypothetical protein